MTPDSGRNGTSAADEAFLRLYETKLRPAAERIEGRQRRAGRRAAGGAALAFLAAAAVFSRFPGLFASADPRLADVNWFAILLVAGVVAVPAYLTIRKRLLAAAAREYRTSLVWPIAEAVDKRIAYDASGGVSAETFGQSLLFADMDDGYGRFAGSGLFSVGTGRRGFAFSGLRADRVIRHGCRRSVNAVFGGIFFTAGMERSIDEYMLVVPRSAEAHLCWIGERIRERGMTPGESVASGDAGFDKSFVAYAPDRGIVDRLLIPQLRAGLTAAREACGGDVYFSVVRERIYAALLTGRDHFALPPPGRALDMRHCLECYRDIGMCLGMVEVLKIDPRPRDAESAPS